jgi:DNA-binding transcriptional LysR family regulator
LLVDRFVNLVEEGVDVAVRIGELGDSALQARRVGEVRRILVASPAYLSVAGVPSQPTELRQHSVIAFTGTSASDEWRFGAKERTAVNVKPRLVVTSADAAIAAAEAGLGITRVLSYQVTEQLEDGRLSELLAEAAPLPAPVNILFQAAGARPRTSAAS